jgi:acetamidase/formamidase
MGFSPDLKTAAEMAVRNMIGFLVETKHMKQADAYMLVSVACDMTITQVVDTNDGVHVTCAKSLFK